MIDLDCGHCVFCLLEWRIPEPKDGLCTNCRRGVSDGQLPEATAENPLVYTWQQHSALRLNDWLLHLVDRKGVSPHQVHSLSANGDLLVRTLCPSETNFPVRVFVHLLARSAEDIAAIAASGSQSRTRSSTDNANIPPFLQDAPELSQHAAPTSRHLQWEPSGPVVVYILQVSRSTRLFKMILGDAVPNATLRDIQQTLLEQGIDASRGGRGPKLFAHPEVARDALERLSRQHVRLGNREYLLNDLRPWHIIVEEDFVVDVKEVLNQLPGKDHVRVRDDLTASIELASVPVVRDDGLQRLSEECLAEEDDEGEETEEEVQDHSLGTGVRGSNVCGGNEFKDIQVVVRYTFIDVTMPSRSTGQVTASTGERFGLNPRRKRMRFDSPESESMPSAISQAFPSQSLPSTASTQTQSSQLSGFSQLTLNNDGSEFECLTDSHVDISV